jgi:hypothetical protein
MVRTDTKPKQQEERPWARGEGDMSPSFLTESKKSIFVGTPAGAGGIDVRQIENSECHKF